MSMDARSVSTLKSVHPDLVKIATKAFELTKQPFVIYNGLRTVAQERANVEHGASETMHSRHLPNKQGVACAIDVYALVDGKPNWEAAKYQPIAAAFLLAAHDLALHVEWGGNWTTLKDWGHFQLPWALYP